MSWSLEKERALREATAAGVPYDVALAALSDVADEDADRVLRELLDDPSGRPGS